MVGITRRGLREAQQIPRVSDSHSVPPDGHVRRAASQVTKVSGSRQPVDQDQRASPGQGPAPAAVDVGEALVVVGRPRASR